ncbi:MAG: TonB-dependent receptor [Phenylobacterium sp.]|nr:TonB-dependent receptor [Phenylobacterium sp.]
MRLGSWGWSLGPGAPFAWLAAGLLAVVPHAAHAEIRSIAFDIPPQPLGPALNQLAVQSNRQILFSSLLTAGRRSTGLQGLYSPEQALSRLLAGTGLTVRLEGTSFLVQQAALRGEEGPAAQPVDSPAAVDEVVVTALKRESLAQDTPISMTVVDGDLLKARGSVDLEHAATYLPGLRLTWSSFGRRLVLRGVYAAGEATTGLYYDETPVTGPVGTTADPGVMSPELMLVDVKRIEVLRGPQGTLYGAGSMGGTLRILFNRPDLAKPSGLLSASVAGAWHGGTAGGLVAVANQPLVKDRLAIRLVAYDYGAPGAVDNLTLGLKNVDASRVQGVRATLLWAPDERLEAQLSGAIQHTHVNDISSWQQGVGPWRTTHAVRAPFDGDIGLVNATVRWRTTGATLTATSSWYRWRLIRRNDYSGVLRGQRNNPQGCSRYFGLDAGACGPVQLAGYTAYVDGLYPAGLVQPVSLTSWINEVRAASNGPGPLDWTLGAYTERRRDAVDSEVVQADPLTGMAYAPVRLIGQRSIENEFDQTAVFGEASWEVRPGTVLTAGGRRYRYHKRDRGEVQVANVVSGTWLDYQADDATHESGWDLKVLASQRLGPGALTYIQASQGFRPGGVNIVPGLPEALAAYRSDSLWNYEAGLKSEWFGRRLLVNLAVYRIDWRDMQYSAQTRNGAFTFLTNIGASRIYGAEMEVVARPRPAWTVSTSLTFTDAHLTADQFSNTAIGLGQTGDRLPMIPQFEGAASVERTWWLAQDAQVVMRLDAAASSTAWSTFNHGGADDLKLGGYAVFGSSLSLSRGDWSVSLAVDNLLNRAGKNQALPSTAGPVEVFGLRPRTARLTLERRL